MAIVRRLGFSYSDNRIGSRMYSEQEAVPRVFDAEEWCLLYDELTALAETRVRSAVRELQPDAEWAGTRSGECSR